MKTKIKMILIIIDNKIKMSIPFQNDHTWIKQIFNVTNFPKKENDINFNTFNLIKSAVEEQYSLGLNFDIAKMLDYFVFQGYASDLINFNFIKKDIYGNIVSFKTKFIEKEILIENNI